jgi:hypothetical protein
MGRRVIKFMMIIDVLNAIKTAINSALPELRRCEVHGGRFDLAELKRVATQTPAVFVSLLGTTELSASGTSEKDIELNIAIYIVTSDKVQLSRSVSIINLAQAIMMLVDMNQWQVTGKRGTPKDISSQNLYSGDIDRNGIAMWAISFKQKVRLGTDIWLDNGVLPSSVYINGDLVI